MPASQTFAASRVLGSEKQRYEGSPMHKLAAFGVKLLVGNGQAAEIFSCDSWGNRWWLLLSLRKLQRGLQESDGGLGNWPEILR